MNYLLRHFRERPPVRPTGRWFTVLMLVGAAAVVYVAAVRWPHLGRPQRFAEVVKVAFVVLCIALIEIGQAKQRADHAKPTV